MLFKLRTILNFIHHCPKLLLNIFYRIRYHISRNKESPACLQSRKSIDFFWIFPYTFRMKNIIETIFYFIVGHGRGWAFSPNDLLPKVSRQQADSVLSELVKQGKIRRVARGIYDYPAYSKLLQKTLSPDIDQVACAYARKFNWRIEASGEAALNLMGLSTQIPAAYVYLSDGPTRRYDIMGTTLKFKQSALKNIGFKHRESALLVQALRTLGKDHITEMTKEKIRQKIPTKQYDKILKDTQSTTNWIYETIKEILHRDTVYG